MSHPTFEHRGDTAMPKLPDAYSQPLHSTPLHDRTSRTLHAPSSQSRRSSRIHSTLSKVETTTSPTTLPTDRERHWSIILNTDPNPQDRVTSPPSATSSERGTVRSSSHSQQRLSRIRSPATAKFSSSKRRASSAHQVLEPPRNTRSPPPKPFRCDQCVRRFERRGHLEVRISSRLVQFVVNYYFLDLTILFLLSVIFLPLYIPASSQSHVDAVHHQRQPYVCDFLGCGKNFSHRSSLSRHMKGVHEKHRFPGFGKSRGSTGGGAGSGSTVGYSMVQQ